ncbi:hypothetical protein ACJJI4_04100 [Microbulbifer sp. TRSA002]|uniref:AbiU2 domain-containing protein n=1 Tax=Microbulbifer sp. TRSA002 TaxID=3243382 RepID=UPI004039FD31
MKEIDRYIIEAMRIRRNVVVYSELFGSLESVKQLAKVSSRAFSVIQRSMHDEVVISLSRIFDKKYYKQEVAGETTGDKEEVRIYCLSQRRVVSKYLKLATLSKEDKREVEVLKVKTRDLVSRLNFKRYRGDIVAHNNESVLLGEAYPTKHNLETASILELIDSSLQLMFLLKRLLTGSTKVSSPVNLLEKWEGVGADLLMQLRKI